VTLVIRKVQGGRYNTPTMKDREKKCSMASQKIRRVGGRGEVANQVLTKNVSREPAVKTGRNLQNHLPQRIKKGGENLKQEIRDSFPHNKGKKPERNPGSKGGTQTTEKKNPVLRTSKSRLMTYSIGKLCVGDNPENLVEKSMSKPEPELMRHSTVPAHKETLPRANEKKKNP